MGPLKFKEFMVGLGIIFTILTLLTTIVHFVGWGGILLLAIIGFGVFILVNLDNM